MEFETSAWVLVIILSVMLFIFLIIGIILLVKLLQLVKETRKVVETGQGIVEKADGIADNVKQATAVGGIVKVMADAFVSGFSAGKGKSKSSEKKEKK